MPQRYVAAAAFFLPFLAAAPALGQSPPAPADVRGTIPLPITESSTCPSWACAVDGPAACPDSRGPRVWGDAAYLLWWVKDGPLGVPLVTTGSKAKEIKRMLDLGIRATVHSDDPAYFRGYMNENFVCTQEEGALSKDEVVQLSRNAFESTWLPRSLKDGYLAELTAYAGQ